MKYIIVKDRDDEEHAIIFPDKVVHKDVARIHRATDVRVVSAGFCSLKDGTITAWGESETLKIGSRPEDAEVIKADFANEL